MLKRLQLLVRNSSKRKVVIQTIEIYYDLLEYTLSQMYDWESIIMKDCKTQSIKSDVKLQDMPGQKLATCPFGYYFPGYFAFILFESSL